MLCPPYVRETPMATIHPAAAEHHRKRWLRHASASRTTKMVNHNIDECARRRAHQYPRKLLLSVQKGLTGVYQPCAEKHVHRYLAEFDFRYNNRAAVGINDEIRAERAIRGIVGKTLTYRTPH
jgi:hypothetical protein